MNRDRTMLGMLAAVAARELDRSGKACERWLEEQTGKVSIAAPSARVQLDAGLNIWRQLPQFTECETIGLQLAGRVPVSTLHLLGTAVSSAPHLFASLQVLCRYFPYLCMVDHLSDRIAGNTMTIVWDDAADTAPACLRDFILAEIVVVLQRLGLRPVRPVHVEIAGDAPRRWRRYAHVFGCPVEFEQSQSRLSVDISELSTPLYGSNPALHTAVIHRLGAFDRNCSSMSARVVGALEQLLDTGEVRIEAVAHVLGMSTRAVQKQLASEGSQFSEILRRVRQRRALALLCETNAPIAGVALALGYQNVGSFSRAFHEWFGSSPAAFREAGRPV